MQVPWWKRVLFALASIGMPLPAVREMREQFFNPPAPDRTPVDRSTRIVIWTTSIVFTIIVVAILTFVVVSLLR